MKKNGLVVHEVNNTVEFKGLAKVAKKNIPKEMVEFALNSARRNENSLFLISLNQFFL